ncbi:sensor histidine kinase [Mycobacteroides chelonae]|uniref:sensor histidine kinase n=1 Tax=Mycobacteroides chelonae TaxID=1774 RepID=UPI0008A94217|nr:sensor histidine kinase KdpD [Mycobacteroides chelonae]MBV0919289.1 sensor histidine kinase KdpD [Mycobacteroides chelonae]OHT81027.1 histidine kinase [Mycobacteroides chelonae]GLE59698.1 sensor protein KdpD [Mycobacteroides chelonae]
MPDGLRARGTLRIYLGAAPGVGKTYAMLNEAHRRAGRGTDVVAATVETHGRSKTAEMLDGLELIPPKETTYRGTLMHELDVDAVLARKPALVLIDEMAHTNAPGSRNPKRWQDIDEILDAGIDVLTTINVQHLESLNDVVEQITGIVQRETVPDAVVRRAEQVELVDITPEALRRRMVHGNVYAPEKVGSALSNYFRTGNLTALRELALLWLADQVDAALAKYRSDNRITKTWEARERVVVAVTGGPESETLVRRASRIAAKSSAELLVVHVVRGDGLVGASTAVMARVRRLANDIGASVQTVTGDDVPQTLLDFARGVNATQLVLGTSRRSRWARIFDEGVAAAVIRDSGAIDVHMVTHGHAGPVRLRSGSMPQEGRKRLIINWLAAILVPPATALFIHFFDSALGVGSKSALFLIAVLAVSLLGGVSTALVSAVISGLLLNYLFVSPRYSFTIGETDNALTILMIMVTAVAVAALVDAAATRARQARRAAREAELLALFAGGVLVNSDLSALLERVRTTYNQTAVSLLCAEGPAVASVGEHPPTRESEADSVFRVDDGAYALALNGPPVPSADARVLQVVAGTAVGLVRSARLAEEASQASALAEADRLRRALLSAVSHDLRTPLAAVKAAVSSLRSPDIEFSPEDTAELLATVEESTDQLTALVGNLLDSSRLAAGVVKPRAVPVYVEEIAHRALLGATENDRKRVHLDLNGAVVRADPGLLERVLANLVDNALRYSQAEVLVGYEEVEDRTLVIVADHGKGLEASKRGAAFDAFQRLGDRDNTVGVGLGLSVVRGFVEAMEGTVNATDTAGGGLTMIVDLPSVVVLR